MYAQNDSVNRIDLAGCVYTAVGVMGATGAQAHLRALGYATGTTVAMYFAHQALEAIDWYNLVLTLATAPSQMLNDVAYFMAGKGRDAFRGGKQSQRDSWHGIEQMPQFPKFKKWFHRIWKKQQKVKDPTPEEMWEAYDEFINSWSNWKG